MRDNQARVQVKVQPNAGSNQVLGLANGVWRIKISAPPDKGKANKELIQFLSDMLGQKKDNIIIVKGQTSHNKLIAIEGLTQAAVNARLSQE